jgi:hypothetical protein
MKRSVIYLVGLLPYLAIANASDLDFKYEVLVDRDLRSLAVSVCFDSPPPNRLFGNDSAGSVVSNPRLDTGEALEVIDEGIVITETELGRCIFYDVQLQPRTQGEQRGGAETRLVGQKHMLTSIGDWLLRPEPDSGYRQFQISFRMPSGRYVSAPWKRTGEALFVGYNSPIAWEGVVVFSHQKSDVIEVNNSIFEVTILGKFPRLDREDFNSWIREAAQGVSSLLGFFPRSRVQVIITPSDRGSAIIPWAYITRGGGAAIHLFVRRSANLEQLLWDWSLPHEMSHFMLPHIDSGDYWLIEGLPTYLQHLSMTRSGSISPDEAWSRLNSGFLSGERAGNGSTVSESTARLAKRGTYRHVYWGGAAFFFRRDVELRVRSGGNESLLEILMKYHECCYDESQSVSADLLLGDFDSFLGYDFFMSRKRLDIEVQMFPDYADAFQELGLQFLGGHPVYAREVRNGIAEQIMSVD